MKPKMALKPLVFALAAVMAVAAQAGGRGHDNHGGHNGGHNGHNNNDNLLLQLLITAGSAATVTDIQSNGGNQVLNQATRNDARMDSSANGSQGNLGANVAAGDGNQQDNVAAIATADENFIFGSAMALSTATQTNGGNTVANYSTYNNASLTNSANGSSGNIGVNVTAGDFNQQKNNLAIAVSGGRVAVASAGANQTTSGLNVQNNADRTYSKDTLHAGFAAWGSYEGNGWGYVEDERSGGHGHKGGKVDKDPLKFHEEGTFGLAGVASYQVLTPNGWKNPVTNTAVMSNSLNGVSGNVGANVSAGSGNQQSNSLSIAAGCKACM
ncbi:heme utilization protein [Pseudomonas guariconensis]|uniref:heme utilization protein n=1 Tax=Pseudomonas TaxID=286 RepID=UPI001CE3BCA1|nr:MULTISPECIES: heme utilization protein [Pseudomonas]MCO7639038.1 heme utilization protein [Pseudomonas sp. S 311-6]MCO7514324.1 heme utilization protein [Pseudomonas putida]MCO7564865.1 heme utilization protein [Pseudomonas mosselii]MCO7593762.1 heme utilization protein [Pseudomonas guariconensis]MCO7606007.1 heme utilization protein [Pseudomonas guariconensis]